MPRSRNSSYLRLRIDVGEEHVVALYRLTRASAKSGAATTTLCCRKWVEPFLISTPWCGQCM